MSFVCDNCGKNPVDGYGQWCSQCQEEEGFRAQEDQAYWFAQCALCLKCAHPTGPDPNDQCTVYDMPLYMVKRKRKCKHFKDYGEPPKEVFF